MKIKTITKKWLQKQGACDSDIQLWDTVKISDPTIGLRWLMRSKRYSQANCLIVQMMTKKQYCQYANYATEQAIKAVLKVYHDPTWVEWARKWISGEDRSARAAADAANWAADAANWATDANWAADANWATDAANWAAWAASRAAAAANWAAALKKMQLKILRYGLSQGGFSPHKKEVGV